uniref:B30.2/SPRY domain-containing protein n=1 Tax=Leptobrachium leishanense TaxID=445787 RepID=A0A8C5WJJ7_9ANUR
MQPPIPNPIDQDPTGSTRRQEMEGKVEPALKPDVTLLLVKSQLLQIKEDSWNMIENFEEKMRKTKDEAALDREKIHESFQDIQDLLRKEEYKWLDKNESMEEKALLALEKAVLDLTNLSEDITELVEKVEKKQTRRKFLIKARSQLKAMDDLEPQLAERMPPLHTREWKGMRHVVKPVPERLHFDQESAHPNLLLSTDSRQVMFMRTSRVLKGRKRCFEPSLYVLGLPGFQSGRHYWEVQVGNNSNWVIGVVRESVERKGAKDLSPINGYWVIRKQAHNIYYGVDISPLYLNLKSQPLRIGVCLDFFARRVEFYDADTTDLIFEFNKFTVNEQIFPFFCPGVPKQQEDWCSLILCP